MKMKKYVFYLLFLFSVAGCQKEALQSDSVKVQGETLQEVSSMNPNINIITPTPTSVRLVSGAELPDSESSGGGKYKDCQCYMKVNSVISTVPADQGWFIGDVTYGSDASAVNHLFEFDGPSPSLWIDRITTSFAIRPLPSIFQELSVGQGLYALNSSAGTHMFYVGPGFVSVPAGQTFIVFTSYECRTPRIHPRGNPTGDYWVVSGDIKFDWASGESIGDELPVRRYFVDFECFPIPATDESYYSEG